MHDDQLKVLSEITEKPSNSDIYEALFLNASEGWYVVDRQRNVLQWNPAAERISGYGALEVQGNRCYSDYMMHVDERGNPLCSGTACPLRVTLDGGESHTCQVLLRHKLGHRVAVTVRTVPVRKDGEVVGAIEIFSETMPQNEARQRVQYLEQLAYLDALTSVANRRYAQSRLEVLMSEHEKLGVPFAVIMVDLDHFKRVNDVHGHQAGDLVLQTVARSLASGLRAGDVVARWGGEEFLLLLPRSSAETVASFAERCRVLVMSSSCQHGDTLLKITASIGAAQVRPGDTPESLLERVDALLYRSKEAGRNCVTLGESEPLLRVLR